MVGSSETRLVIVRGNSGSGKSSVARLIQRRQPRGQVAVVPQDVVRRDVLWARDVVGNAAVGLIDVMTRYSLDAGYSVVVEGILDPERYADMLERLALDHQGPTFGYFWDIPFEETVRRHANKPEASEFGESEMRDWWYGKALIPNLQETTIGAELTLEETVRSIERDCGWS